MLCCAVLWSLTVGFSAADSTVAFTPISWVAAQCVDQDCVGLTRSLPAQCKGLLLDSCVPCQSCRLVGCHVGHAVHTGRYNPAAKLSAAVLIVHYITIL